MKGRSRLRDGRKAGLTEEEAAVNAQITNLLTAFERARKPEPAELQSAIASLPEPGALPSPWETWTLIGLVRHRERQER
jgi:hypothetical protein